MYTVEIYKLDRRTKNGERLVRKVDHQTPDRDALLLAACKDYPANRGYRIEIHETYVTRRNLVSGNEFQERYDTPYYCSPSSETYWST